MMKVTKMIQLFHQNSIEINVYLEQIKIFDIKIEEVIRGFSLVDYDQSLNFHRIPYEVKSVRNACHRAIDEVLVPWDRAALS